MASGLFPISLHTPNARNKPCLTNSQYVRLFSLMILISMGAYFGFFWYMNRMIVVESYVEDIAPIEVVEQRKDFHEVVIERLCSTDTERCYKVVDQPVEDHVERSLIVDGFNLLESDTNVRLIPPKGEAFENSDTRIWKVDHSRFYAQYLAAMFIAPFAFTTFSLEDKSESKSVLEIGLGGGSFSMYLRNQRKNYNITAVELDPTVATAAERWFGIESDNLRRTVIGDGIEFLKNAVLRNEKWDMILLDACDTSKERPCPVRGFLEPEVVLNIRNSVKPKGVVVVNILSMQETESEIREVASAFSEHFEACAALHVTLEVNVVLVCVPYTIANPTEQLRFIEQRIAAVIKHFDLGYLLSQVVLSALY